VGTDEPPLPPVAVVGLPPDPVGPVVEVAVVVDVVLVIVPVVVPLVVDVLFELPPAPLFEPVDGLPVLSSAEQPKSVNEAVSANETNETVKEALRFMATSPGSVRRPMTATYRAPNGRSRAAW
jgi:hypothetical protein